MIYDANGRILADIETKDDSFRYRELSGDHYVELKFEVAEPIEIPLLSYVEYDGVRYTLYNSAEITMSHSRAYAYKARFDAPQGLLRQLRMRNPVDGCLEFTLTATPIEHLNMIVAVLNAESSGWTAFAKSAEAKTITYNYNTCLEALQVIADTFGMEWNINVTDIELGLTGQLKVPSRPLELAYGRGNGLLPGVGRVNYSSEPPLNVVYAQGGTRNIDASIYGSPKLLLPKGASMRYDGVYFDNEDGFGLGGRVIAEYETNIYGLAVRKAGVSGNIAEGALDCTDIYPQRESDVSSVRVDNGVYYIIDNTIPESLNYEDCLIAGGGPMTIVFQSGELAGKEFNADYYHTASGSYPARRFKIEAQDIDGITMPGGTFVPKRGDRYKVFNVALPASYIADNATKSGASWDMFRKCVRHLYEHEKPQYTIKGEVDAIWAEGKWDEIKSKVFIGGDVSIVNEAFSAQNIILRITSIKDFINKPYEPTLGFAPRNTAVTSVKTLLRKMQGEIAGLREASAQNKQQTRVSAHVLGSRIDDVEQGGGGSGANVIIQSLNETYIETTNASTDSGKVLKVGAKTAMISSTDNGLATAEDVRTAISNIQGVSHIDTNTGDYISVAVATKQVDKDKFNTFIVDAKTADIASSSNGLAKAEDVRARLAVIGGYQSADVNYLVATTMDINVTLTPNKIETRISTNGYRYVTLTIPSSTADNKKDDVYIFRGYMRGQSSVNGDKAKVSVVSDASTQPTIVWKDNNIPDAITNVGYIEVRIKVFSKTLYLGEWSYYPTSVVINE